LFAADNIGLKIYRLLQNAFEPNKRCVSVLLSSKIRSIDTNSPLLALQIKSKRAAYLLGENSWKWRLQTHVNNQSLKNMMFHR
jgi:hypothetical protein